MQIPRRQSLPPPPKNTIPWEDYFTAAPGKPPRIGRPIKGKTYNKSFHATVAMVSYVFYLLPMVWVDRSPRLLAMEFHQYSSKVGALLRNDITPFAVPIGVPSYCVQSFK